MTKLTVPSIGIVVVLLVFEVVFLKLHGILAIVSSSLFLDQPIELLGSLPPVTPFLLFLLYSCIAFSLHIRTLNTEKRVLVLLAASLFGKLGHYPNC